MCRLPTINRPLGRRESRLSSTAPLHLYCTSAGARVWWGCALPESHTVSYLSRWAAYRWRSLSRVCRHRASNPQGSFSNWCCHFAGHHGPINVRLSFPTSTIGMKWACWYKYLTSRRSSFGIQVVAISQGARAAEVIRCCVLQPKPRSSREDVALSPTV